MDINRSSFYKWRDRQRKPTDKIIERESNIKLFKEYHDKYPSHGYRWLNSKIRHDTGLVFSDTYAQRVCHYCGIKSASKRFRGYKAAGRECIYPNMVLADIVITRPFQVIVSDMTMIKIKGKPYEITFYMDLFNNAIIAWAVSDTKGDRNTYINGRDEVIKIKEEAYPDYDLILHTDQGSVYASKDFNKNLLLRNITRSMSRAGTPTDNGAMESINGWVKDELYLDFKINDSDNVEESIREYVDFFNNERPAYALGYKTPKEVMDEYLSKKDDENDD